MAKRGQLRNEMKAARKELTLRMGKRSRSSMNQLIELHGLEGESARKLEAVSHEQFSEPERVNESLWSAVGGLVAGAGGGLAADVASGGMSLGGGVILGGLGGGAGAYFLARGYNLARGGENSVRWSLAHLREQLKMAVLSYLAVAHFGRGRGEWKDGHVPDFWAAEVDMAIEPNLDSLAETWKKAADETDENAILNEVTDLVSRTSRETLASLYPGSMKRA